MSEIDDLSEITDQTALVRTRGTQKQLKHRRVMAIQSGNRGRFNRFKKARKPAPVSLPKLRCLVDDDLGQ